MNQSGGWGEQNMYLLGVGIVHGRGSAKGGLGHTSPLIAEAARSSTHVTALRPAVNIKVDVRKE